MGMGRLLLGWVVGEVYALADVTLQAFYAGLEEGLLVFVEVGEGVEGLFGSGCLFCMSAMSVFEWWLGNVRRARRGRRRNRSQSPWRLPHHLEHLGGRRKLG
jgi:hypothetical protein